MKKRMKDIEQKIVEDPVLISAENSMPIQDAEPVFSLDQYFVRKGIRPHHRGGMRAFTSVGLATMSKWEQIFSGY